MINPLVEMDNLKLEVKELPALLPFIDDENYVLAYGYWRDFHPTRYMYQVNGFVVEIINRVAHRDLIDRKLMERADAAGFKAVREAAEKWIAANAGKTRVQLLLEDVEHAAEFRQFSSAAMELARAHGAEALPLVLKRLDDFKKAEQQAFIVKWCYRASPQATVAQARKWIAAKGDVRFWAAMILFTHGDREKLEGLEAIKEVLAGDQGSDVTHYRLAFDALMASGREEAKVVACGVLERLGTNKSSWEVQPFVHRLLVAGRKEAADFLIRQLDDTSSRGTTWGTWEGKEVSVDLTAGDKTGQLIADMRSDTYAYPWGAAAELRVAERKKLKAWVAEQYELIRVGKASAIRPAPERMDDNDEPRGRIDAP